MPFDDRDPYGAVRFRMARAGHDQLRRRAAWDAAARTMARAGEALRRLRDGPAATVAELKASVPANTDMPLGGAMAKAPAPRSRTKGEAARDFGAGILLDRIAEGEGTGGPDGYDTTFGYGRFDPPGWDKPISRMTLDELDAFQAGLAKRSRISSAVGRYQINRRTMGDLRKRMRLVGSELYSPEMQDRLGRERLRMARWDDYVAGRITRDQVQERLARGWASVATAEGRSYYDQPVGTTSEQIRAAIDQARAEAEHLRTIGGDPSEPAWR